MDTPTTVAGQLTLTKGGKTICENTTTILTLGPPVEHQGDSQWAHGWHFNRIHAPVLFTAEMYTDGFDVGNEDEWFDVVFKGDNGITYTGRGFKTLMAMASKVIDLQGAEPLQEHSTTQA
jgi:hypothetical protein